MKQKELEVVNDLIRRNRDLSLALKKAQEIISKYDQVKGAAYVDKHHTLPKVYFNGRYMDLATMADHEQEALREADQLVKEFLAMKPKLYEKFWFFCTVIAIVVLVTLGILI